MRDGTTSQPLQAGLPSDRPPFSFHGPFRSWGRSLRLILAGMLLGLLPNGNGWASDTPKNQVLQLDGKGSFAELPDRLGEDWEAATLEFRARWDGLSYYPALLQFGGTESSIVFTQDDVFPAPKVYAQSREGRPRVIGLEDRVDLGVWVHLAATFEASRLRFWVNGVCMGTNDLPSPGLTALRDAPARWLGRSAWKDNGFFQGRIDELRLWNRVLSQEELSRLPRTPVTGTEPGLWARWSMDAWVKDGDQTVCWSDGAQRLPAVLRGGARAVEDPSTDTATFEAPWWLEGTVRGPDGRPAAADLRWLEDDLQWWRVATDNEGRYRWRGLRSGVSGHLRSTAGAVGILTNVVLSRGRPMPLDLVLDAEPSVEGRIVRWDDAARAGVRVRIRGTDPEAGLSKEGWITQSDASGRFVFPALPEGEYEVECDSTADAFSASGDSAVPPQRVRVRRDEGPVRVTFRVAAGGDATPWTRFTRRDGLPDNSLTSLVLDGKGVLWIGTSGGLARYDGTRFTAWTHELGLAEGQVSALAIDGEDRLWVAGKEALVRREGNGFVPVPITTAELGLSIIDMTTSRDGALWLATNQGVHRYHNGLWRVFGVAQGLPGGVLRCLWPDDGNSVRASFIANLDVRLSADGVESHLPQAPFAWGLNPLRSPGSRVPESWIDRERGKWKRWGFPLVRGDGVLVNPENLQVPWALQVRSILESSQGEIWVATHQHGLLRVKAGTPRNLTPAHGLPPAGVRVSLRAKEGTLWIGTSAGLLRWDGTATRLYRVSDGLPDNEVFDLLEAPDGAIWVAGGRGIARWFEGRFQGVSGLPPANTYPLRLGPEGRIWALVPGLGLLVGDGQGMQPRHGDATYPYSYALDFLFSASRELWLLAPKGMVRVLDGKALPLAPDAGGPGNDRLRLLQTKDGALWVGTASSGLFRHNRDRGWRHFDIADGLASRAVHALHEDGRGWLWVGTSDGVNLHRDGLWSHLDDLDGLAGLDVRHIRSEDDGSVWISTDGGLTRYVPAFAPPAAAWRNPPRQATPVSKDIEEPVLVGHRLNFAVEMASSHWLRWRVQEGDSWGEWQTVRGRAEWDWTPTRVGTAAIEAQVVDRDLNRSAILRRELQIQAEWHRRATVVAPLAAAGIGLAGLLLYQGTTLRRQRRESAGLKEEARILAAADLARMEFERRLIRTQEAERGRISRELHDSLGQELLLIRNSALLAQRSAQSDPVKPVLGEIADRASRTIEGVRTIAYSLRPQELDRYGLAAAMRALCQDLASTDSPEIEFHADSELPPLGPEVEIGLFRILQECLTNVLKHAGAARVECRLACQESGARLQVTDHGRGFDPDSTKSEPMGGLGLSGMQERVRLLGGRFQVRSKPGQGTTVDVWIPATPVSPQAKPRMS